MRRAILTLCLCLLSTLPALARRVQHVRTETGVDWVSAGIGGVESGGGVIQLTGVTGPVRKAFLYWHGVDLKSRDEDSDLDYDNGVIQFNGATIVGTAIGEAPTNCWGEGSSRAFRADVTFRVTGNGPYIVTDLAREPAHSPNGVSLIVLFDDGNPANDKNLAFFEGNDSARPEGYPGEDPGWHARLDPVIYGGGAVFAEFHVADGQVYADGSIQFATVDDAILQPDAVGLWDGTSVPSAGGSRAPNGGLWDIIKLDVSGAFGASRGRIALNVDGMEFTSDCLGLVVLVIETEARPNVAHIEVTQAIQQLQTVEQLEADLEDDGDPPVPLVEGKPTAIRVTFEQPATTLTVNVHASIPGVLDQTKAGLLTPGCTKVAQLTQSMNCDTVNFAFVSPDSDFELTVDVIATDGSTLERYVLPFDVTPVREMKVSGVRVCDQFSGGAWQCENSYMAKLGTDLGLLRKILPTGDLQLFDTGDTIQEDIGNYDADGNGAIDSSEAILWGSRVGYMLATLRSLDTGKPDKLAGVVRSTSPASIGVLGLTDNLPGEAALYLSPAFDFGVDQTQITIAHELLHSMGCLHPNSTIPLAATVGGVPVPPGCHLAADPDTDWPYPDCRLQSGPASAPTVQIGFDPVTAVAHDGTFTFDIMGYCEPQWIAEHNYLKLLNGYFKTLFRRPLSAPPSDAPTRFWLVAGRFDADGIAFSPLQTMELEAAAELGEGTHAIEARDAGGTVLARRAFTPRRSETRVRSGVEDQQSVPYFAERVPYFAAAATLVVVDPAGVEVDRITLGGAAPVVTITAPAEGQALSGDVLIDWSVSDEDSSAHSYWVQYSPAGGAPGTWSTLAQELHEPHWVVSTELLAGAPGSGVVRVLASDGVNSSEGRVGTLTVPPHDPEVFVLSPADGALFAKDRAIELQGFAIDRDDQQVTDRGLAWTSDRDGELGLGPTVVLTGLSPGSHRITLTAHDSDGNQAQHTVRIGVAAFGPSVSLVLEGAEVEPARCVNAAIGVVPGSFAVERLEYSLDGGEAWLPLDATALSVRVPVSGPGLVHVVVRVVDVAGQQDAKDRHVFVEGPCTSGVPTAVAGLDASAECGAGRAEFPLDASASSDPDRQPLSCLWRSERCSLDDATACVTTARCPAGTQRVTLEVSDGENISAPDELLLTAVDLTPPAGAIVFPPSGSCQPAPIVVIDDFADACDSPVSRSYSPAPGPSYAAEGAYDVQLTATDAEGNSATARSAFVIDATPPRVALADFEKPGTSARREPLSRYLASSDDDAAPGEPTLERILIGDCVVLDGALDGDRDGRLVDETIAGSLELLCAAMARCGTATLIDPVLRAEAQDCAGNRSGAAQQLRGRFELDTLGCEALRGSRP